MTFASPVGADVSPVSKPEQFFDAIWVPPTNPPGRHSDPVVAIKASLVPLLCSHLDHSHKVFSRGAHLHLMWSRKSGLDLQTTIDIGGSLTKSFILEFVSVQKAADENGVYWW